MRKKFSITSLACLPLLACGGSDSGTKTVLLHDGKVFLDGSAGACTAKSSYTTLGNMGGALDLAATGSSAHAQILFTTLGSNDATEALFLSGGGLFPTNIVPGTYQITGDETNFATCSLCFLLGPGAFNGTQIKLDFSNVYMATAGSVTITATGSNAGSGSGHQLAGTVANLTFKKVIIDLNAGTQTDDPSNCTSSIGSGGFGYNLQAGSANFAGAENTDANAVISPERLQILRDMQAPALTNRYH